MITVIKRVRRAPICDITIPEIPPNALRGENGQPILNENGEYILI